jgi:hypothetical protein
VRFPFFICNLSSLHNYSSHVSRPFVSESTDSYPLLTVWPFSIPHPLVISAAPFPPSLYDLNKIWLPDVVSAASKAACVYLKGSKPEDVGEVSEEED